ncbi:hypothetical protein L1887_50266 [Cichorium endivia]|nr:hypothetical protein L1887_50266 [Cichorium endivia]
MPASPCRGNGRAGKGGFRHHLHRPNASRKHRASRLPTQPDSCSCTKVEWLGSSALRLANTAECMACTGVRADPTSARTLPLSRTCADGMSAYQPLNTLCLTFFRPYRRYARTSRSSNGLRLR